MSVLRLDKDCRTCQNKFLDYKFFCVDCKPYADDETKSNYENMHENEGAK